MGYKSVSADGGKTWDGPYQTKLAKCIGRPRAGILESGDVAVTYGFDLHPRNLVMHVETVSAGKARTELSGPGHGHLGNEHYIRFPIDHDRSVFSDGAYSGWVNLPGGDIYVVQYIVDDAPMAQIRGYRISRSDYILTDSRTPLPDFSWEEKREAHEKFKGVTDRDALAVSPYHDSYIERSKNRQG